MKIVLELDTNNAQDLYDASLLFQVMNASRTPGNVNELPPEPKQAAKQVNEDHKAPDPIAPAIVAQTQPDPAVTTDQEAPKAKKATAKETTDALKHFLKSHTAPEGLALLGEFGAKHLKDLKEEHYAAFVAKARA